MHFTECWNTILWYSETVLPKSMTFFSIYQEIVTLVSWKKDIMCLILITADSRKDNSF